MSDQYRNNNPNTHSRLTTAGEIAGNMSINEKGLVGIKSAISEHRGKYELTEGTVANT